MLNNKNIRNLNKIQSNREIKCILDNNKKRVSFMEQPLTFDNIFNNNESKNIDSSNEELQILLKELCINKKKKK
jgi:hypothetical protein